jgi:ATP-dependent protease ClpP protease subunit
MPITTINGALILDGFVGYPGLYDDDGDTYFTAKEVVQALASAGSKKRVSIRLNSGGGVATEGMAIAAAIKAHAGGVDIVVEGVAASAATPAVCAATTAKIAFGSIFMIHEASNLTLGTIADHQSTIAQLDVMNDSMAGVYAQKTRQPVAAMRDLMRAETWMLAEDAVARGFCDAIVGAPGAHPAMARYDYTRYQHPPAALKAQALAGRREASEAKAQREAWGSIADICLKAGRTDMTADLIMANVSVEEARRRVEKARAQAEGRRVAQESMLRVVERKYGKAARAQAEARFAARGR